ncbi:MAG: peptide-methionine (R)-S-oxide reductase, partial [Gammaproteobacteria bacterium]
MSRKKDTSTAALRARLTPEQFYITQEKGTEPAFTGRFHDCKKDGVYECTC